MTGIFRFLRNEKHGCSRKTCLHVINSSDDLGFNTYVYVTSIFDISISLSCIMVEIMCFAVLQSEFELCSVFKLC